MDTGSACGRILLKCFCAAQLVLAKLLRQFFATQPVGSALAAEFVVFLIAAASLKFSRTISPAAAADTAPRLALQAL